MSPNDVMDWLRWECWEFLIGAWESRHSLFAGFALYGSLLAFLVVAGSALPARARPWVLVAASVAGMGILGSWHLTALALAFSLTLYLVVERWPGPGGTGTAWLLLLALAAYPALLPDDIFAGNPSDMAEFWAFATNVWWLRCTAYVVDRRYRSVAPRRLDEFLGATLFFPTFVNGPIETTESLAACRAAGPASDTWAEFRQWATRLPTAAGRFFWGVAKVLLATFYLGQSNETLFATSGTSVGHLALWLWAAELYVQFYVIFSGWTDVAIALGRVMGFELTENFDRPWRARSVGEFWRRWHISFGLWLRNYIYIPLGGNRRHPGLNVLATFAVSALWHVWGALKVLGPEAYPPAAWTGFLVWGGLNATGQIVARQWNTRTALAPVRNRLQQTVPVRVRAISSQIATFAFVAAAWIPFFLPPWIEPGAFWRIFARMVYLD